MAPRFFHALNAFALVMQATQALAQTPEGFSPQTNNSLAVEYSGSAVVAASPVPITTTRWSPSVQLSRTNTSNIIIMVDVDAPFGPSNNTLAPILHWLAAIPSGTNSLAENQTITNAAAPYMPPNPPAGSVPHRYVILRLESPNSTVELPEGFSGPYTMIENRVQFDVAGFVKAGGFQLLSATWFTVAPANTTVPESAGSLMGSTYSGSLAAFVSILVAMAVYI